MAAPLAVHLEFGGGAELLFDGVKDHHVTLPGQSDPSSMAAAVLKQWRVIMSPQTHEGFPAPPSPRSCSPGLSATAEPTRDWSCPPSFRIHEPDSLPASAGRGHEAAAGVDSREPAEGEA
ncbi:ubiquitin-related modifier 1 isoform X1 [Pygocentrus nattereri]|uniref:ubiquitin-related modifier 1 isoform X1 n=1 Tax=Pygocentrus nattereri TaxID=42514 RepID=UPI00081446F5|nr:ubiquitin-related modifier 1 isoform X1 [Pygocentrus nattereri]